MSSMSLIPEGAEGVAMGRSLRMFDIKILLTELRNVTDVADDETPDWFIKSVA